MTSTERAALLAKVRGTAAPAAPATAPAAKRSSTSRGRGSGAKAAAPVEPAEPAKPAEPAIAVPDERVDRFAAIPAKSEYVEMGKLAEALSVAEDTGDFSRFLKADVTPAQMERLSATYGVEAEAPALFQVAGKTALGPVGLFYKDSQSLLSSPSGKARARAAAAQTYVDSMKAKQKRDYGVESAVKIRQEINKLVAGEDAKYLERVPEAVAYYRDHKKINPETHLAPEFRDNPKARKDLPRYIEQLIAAEESAKPFYAKMLQTGR